MPKAKEALEKSNVQTAAFYATTNEPAKMHLGFPDKGHLSTYYPDSPSITQDEIEQISTFMAEKKLLPENTRLRKSDDGNFQLLIASGLGKPPPEGGDAGPETVFDLTGGLKGKKLELVFGDHIEELAKIALHIKKAGLNAANDTQKRMMDAYAKSFGSGSLNAFKESQKLWVKDIGPMVETNIGFIETYRDPANVRAEWEGLVAMVNKERTEAFQKLVNAAPSMIPKLPWGQDFEKDKFSAPDFTSLEVLTFNGSGIPAGARLSHLTAICVQLDTDTRTQESTYRTTMTFGRRLGSRTFPLATSSAPKPLMNPSPSSIPEISNCIKQTATKLLRCKWVSMSYLATVPESYYRKHRQGSGTLTLPSHLSVPSPTSQRQPTTNPVRRGAAFLEVSLLHTRNAELSAWLWL